jgi:hypothetical protein
VPAVSASVMFDAACLTSPVLEAFVAMSRTLLACFFTPFCRSSSTFFAAATD